MPKGILDNKGLVEVIPKDPSHMTIEKLVEHKGTKVVVVEPNVNYSVTGSESNLGAGIYMVFANVVFKTTAKDGGVSLSVEYTKNDGSTERLYMDTKSFDENSIEDGYVRINGTRFLNAGLNKPKLIIKHNSSAARTIVSTELTILRLNA